MPNFILIGSHVFQCGEIQGILIRIVEINSTCSNWHSNA